MLCWVMMRGMHQEPVTLLRGRLPFGLGLGDHKEDCALFLVDRLQLIRETFLIQMYGSGDNSTEGGIVTNCFPLSYDSDTLKCTFIHSKNAPISVMGKSF